MICIGQLDYVGYMTLLMALVTFIIRLNQKKNEIEIKIFFLKKKRCVTWLESVDCSSWFENNECVVDCRFSCQIGWFRMYLKLFFYANYKKRFLTFILVVSRFSGADHQQTLKKIRGTMAYFAPVYISCFCFLSKTLIFKKFKIKIVFAGMLSRRIIHHSIRYVQFRCCLLGSGQSSGDRRVSCASILLLLQHSSWFPNHCS